MRKPCSTFTQADTWLIYMYVFSRLANTKRTKNIRALVFLLKGLESNRTCILKKFYEMSSSSRHSNSKKGFSIKFWIYTHFIWNVVLLQVDFVVCVTHLQRLNFISFSVYVCFANKQKRSVFISPIAFYAHAHIHHSTQFSFLQLLFCA